MSTAANRVQPGGPVVIALDAAAPIVVTGRGRQATVRNGVPAVARAAPALAADGVSLLLADAH